MYYVILFLVIIMNPLKKISFLLAVVFIIVFVLGYFYLKDNVMISQRQQINYNVDDLIGYINIESINLTSNLMQGMDNTFYLSHNFLKNSNINGEFFLDYQGDLLNNNNAIIYTNYNNIVNLDEIKSGDRIKILYLRNNLCYKVISTKNNKDIIIKILTVNFSNFNFI